MAIIDSVRKLAEKVGADTNGRTIADQLNIINKKLDNTQPGSRDIAEAVSKFADKEDGTAILVTKTITENGTYKASDDSANGYSSVSANVPPYLDAFYFNDTWKRNDIWHDEQTVILRSDTGVYNIPELIANINFASTNGTLNMILLNPVKNIIGLKNTGIEYVRVFFTPASDYEWTDAPDITPNDGKKYSALCTYGKTITQDDNTNADFVYQIF